MSRRTCPQEGCAFQVSGTCVEGHTEAECPFLNRVGTPADALDDHGGDFVLSTVAGAGEPMLSIAPSVQLSPSDADRIRRSTGATLVAFLGALKSGKTTIITEFHELLRRADMGPLSFAGSDTVSGFEYRAYLSRMQSGGHDAGTDRTSGELGLHFLHLELCRVDEPQPRRHLLMSDRAGESFEDALNSPGEFAELDEVRNADFIVFVVDGAQFADPGRRGRHRLQVMSMVQATRDAGLIRESQRVNVVLAKLDIVSLAGDRDGTETSFDSLVSTIRTVLSRTGSEVTGHLVSARSENPAIPRGYGLQELIETWTARRMPAALDPFAVDLSAPSAFDRLLEARRGAR